MTLSIEKTDSKPFGSRQTEARQRQSASRCRSSERGMLANGNGGGAARPDCFAEKRPKFDESRPKFDEKRPILAEKRPKLDENRPKLAENAQNLMKIAQASKKLPES